MPALPVERGEVGQPECWVIREVQSRLSRAGVLTSWSLMTLGLMKTVVEASDVGSRVRLVIRSGRCLSGYSCSQTETGQSAKGTADDGERSGCKLHHLGSALASR